MMNSQSASRWGDQAGPPTSSGEGRGDSHRGGRGYNITDATSMNNQMRGYPREGSGGDDRWRDDRRHSSGGGGQRTSSSFEYGRGGGEGWRDMEESDQYRAKGEDWRCMECGLDNYPQDECCPRCHTWRGEGSSRPRGDRDGLSSRRDRVRHSMDDHRNYPGGGRVDDNDYYGRGGTSSHDDERWENLHDFASRGGRSRRGRDEDEDHDGDEDDFGRARRPRKKSRDDSTPKNREWPPHFESSGASFIFDARSGMFYEPHSDFFYDPKTKLYYSNKKQQYFRYEADKKPHVFQPVGGSAVQTPGQVAGGQGGEGTSPTVTTTKPAEKVESKPKIAISLKTPLPQKDSGTKSLNEVATKEKAKLKEKNIKRKESALSAAGEINATPVTLPNKKHATNMNVWSERVKEMRDEDTCNEDPSKKVKTTASGQPICVLCRRKFATVEKLQQHEKLSALHQENLAKKAAAEAAAASSKKTQQEADTYRDRSKERRDMYGGASYAASSSSHAEALLAHSLGSSSSVDRTKPTEIIRPEDTLNNDTNVGNKLLQKMGWKSGEALGKDTANDSAASKLKNDWERIESLAQTGGRRR